MGLLLTSCHVWLVTTKAHFWASECLRGDIATPDSGRTRFTALGARSSQKGRASRLPNVLKGGPLSATKTEFSSRQSPTTHAFKLQVDTFDMLCSFIYTIWGTNFIISNLSLNSLLLSWIRTSNHKAFCSSFNVLQFHALSTLPSLRTCFLHP